MEIFIDRAETLLKQVWNDSLVKIVENQHKIGRHKFCLIDISLNAHGKQQDEMYIASSFYQENIRRGNTLLEKSEGSGRNSIEWIRKGTQKLIDIQFEHLESNAVARKLTYKDQRTYNYIFSGVNSALAKGRRVDIIRTEKANGQNAQISFYFEFDCWVICSKNVCILVSTAKDIEKYNGARYSYAKQIGYQWFQQIKPLKKEELQSLKNRLDGFTLVGEYCGNPKHQHLIRYNEQKLIWFGLIDNFSNQFCFDPYYVKSEIQKYGFTFVKIAKQGSFINKGDFYQTLQEVYQKTAGASIQDERYGMEGSIVYFTSPEQKSKATEYSATVLGAGKLKTLEYRFFRKVREKLSRKLKNRKLSTLQLTQQFKAECIELQKCNRSRAPYPIQYYESVLSKGLCLVEFVELQETFLRSEFISVLKLIFYAIAKTIDLKKYGSQMIENRSFLEQVFKIPFTKFGTLGCNCKVIFLKLGLPKIFECYLQSNNCFRKLSQKIDLPFIHIEKSLEANNGQGESEKVQKIIQRISGSLKGEVKQGSNLVHYYVEEELSCREIVEFQKLLRAICDSEYLHRLVLVKDHTVEPLRANENEYPFSLQSIMLSYWLVYETVKHCPKIQQKIDQLKPVTDSLKSRSNFEQIIHKKGISSFGVNLTDNIFFSESQKKDYRDIISSILTGEEEFKAYCRLILKLEQLTSMKKLSSEQLDLEIEKLIKNSFPSVATINFRAEK